MYRTARTVPRRGGRAARTVEHLNSPGPHCAAHKGVLAPILAVFAIYHTRRVFPWGERAGHSPLAPLGLPLPHWLDVLGNGRTPAPAAFPARPARTVNRKAA